MRAFSIVNSHLYLGSLLVFFILTTSKTVYGSNLDLEYWQSFNCKNWESGSYKLYTTGQMRIAHDVTRINYNRITENFAYKALSWLDLEAHYSFLYHKPRGHSHFFNSQHLEFEANPTLNFDHDLKLKWRNRLEVIKKQSISQISFVFRHRMMMILPVENWGYLKALRIHDELFYNFTKSKITQNRFVPVEANIALNKCTTLNIFIMIRNFFSANNWYRSIVIGTELDF